MRRMPTPLLQSSLLLFPLLLAGCAGARPEAALTKAAPRREAIYPGESRPQAPYTPAIRSGDLIFFSGQIGSRPGQGLDGTIEGETRQALENLRTLMNAAGVGPADVVKCTVFLADIRDYGAMNRVYGEFFGATPPARTALAVAGLPANARVEVECIAAAPDA